MNYCILNYSPAILLSCDNQSLLHSRGLKQMYHVPKKLVVLDFYVLAHIALNCLFLVFFAFFLACFYCLELSNMYRFLSRYGLDSLCCVLSALWGSTECPEYRASQTGGIWWHSGLPAQWSLQRPQTAWHLKVSIPFWQYTKYFSCWHSCVWKTCVLINYFLKLL